MTGEEHAAGVEQLIAETRRVLEDNRALRARLRARRAWTFTGLALMGVLALYAWSLRVQLAESAALLRANSQLVESGNVLLRATSAQQQEVQSALRHLRQPPPARVEPPRRRREGCPAGPGCDPSTYWVPGFPGPRAAAKRTVLRPGT